MAGNKAETVAVVISEVLSGLSLPGGNTLHRLLEDHQEARRHYALKVLTEEVHAGRHGPLELDEDELPAFVGPMHRFTRAVLAGTARRNLRLLMQVICGLGKSNTLDEDAFNKWCSRIEDLSHDEIITIATAHKVEQRLKPGEQFWKEMKRDMIGGGFTDLVVFSLAASVSRFGFLVPVSAWDGIAYAPSPWLAEVCALADFEHAPQE